jgi:hypothetical protein
VSERRVDFNDAGEQFEARIDQASNSADILFEQNDRGKTRRLIVLSAI